MKTYNTKLAVLVFTVIMALDVVLYPMMHWVSDSWFSPPSLVINLPAVPLFQFGAGLFQPGSLGMGCVFFGSIIFSAALWSVVAGFIFRRRYAV